MNRPAQRATNSILAPGIAVTPNYNAFTKKDINREQTWGARATLRWQPLERLHFDLNFTTQDARLESEPFTDPKAGPYAQQRFLDTYAAGGYGEKVNMGTLTGGYDWDALSLVSVTNEMQMKRFSDQDINFLIGAPVPWSLNDTSFGSVFTQDALNTWDTTTDNKHKVRFYPYRKASGKTVPNTYVMAVEQAFNSDFQDAVLLVENVLPYNAVTAPINLVAAPASSTSIHLSWTDNNDYESSYVIERSRSKNGTFSVVGTTAAGMTVFNDTNLPSNTLYYYRIRAANATGQSAPSMRAAARTNP